MDFDLDQIEKEMEMMTQEMTVKEIAKLKWNSLLKIASNSAKHLKTSSGRKPGFAPAGTKREQITGWLLKGSLSNKIKVLHESGPAPDFSFKNNNLRAKIILKKILTH